MSFLFPTVVVPLRWEAMRSLFSTMRSWWYRELRPWHWAVWFTRVIILRAKESYVGIRE